MDSVRASFLSLDADVYGRRVEARVRTDLFGQSLHTLLQHKKMFERINRLEPIRRFVGEAYHEG